MRFARIALVCLPTLLFFGCPQPPEDVCANISCGSGRCIPANGAPSCLCDTTYVAQGLTCVPQSQSNACANDPCVATGKVCSSINGVATCGCPVGQVASGAGCVNQNPCATTTCSAANQTCQVSNGAAQCVCNAGYAPVGNGCSVDPVYNCAKNHSGGASDDAFEPNECPETATAYDLTTSPQTHTLGPAGDEDWIRVSPQQGNITSVVITNSNVPLFVDVYGQDGVTVVASDHRGVNTPSFRFVAQSSSMHFIRVRALRANDVGSYTLTVSDVGADDFTNQVVNAITLAPGTQTQPALFEGEIQYLNDEDVIKVTVLAGRTYRLVLNTSTATGIQVDVVGVDGVTRKSLTEANTAGTSHLVHSKVDGMLTLKAKSEGIGALGAFSVALTDLGLDDHGDVVMDATVLNPSPNAQTGSFETRPSGAPADTDVFAFAVQAGNIYAFTCTSGTSSYGCVMSLRDAAGTVLSSGSGYTTKTISAEALSAGTWNVSISPYSVYLGTVTYKLEDLGADDFGDDRPNAAPLTVGTAKTGRVESSGDVDYFSFTAQAGRIYQFGCVPDSTLSYCSARVVDAVGTQVASSSQTSFEALSNGTYYVEVKPTYTGYLGAYSITVTDVGADDHGDTAAAATMLTLGTAAPGNIEVSSDRDFFGLSATAGTIYTVSCSTSTTYLCYLTVRDPSNVAIVTTSYGSAISTSFKAASTGVYTVEARSYSTTTGTYSITATTAGADDHVDTAAGATPAPFNQTMNGNIQFAGDKDVFSFTGATGRIYKIVCTSASSTYLCVQRVNGPTNALVTSTSYGATTTASFEATSSGTFTVELSAYSTAYSGAYTIVVTDEGADDYGDSYTAATPITVGGSGVNGRIELAYDVDVFSFTGTANRIYRYTCTSTTTDQCAMVARNSVGTSITSVTYGASTVLSFMAPSTGTYFLEVKARTTYTGTYTVQVFDDGADDFPDTAAAATTVLTLPATTSGNIQTTTDKDVLKFNVGATRLYKLSCTSNHAYGCRMVVRDGSNLSVGTSTYGTTVNYWFEPTTNGTFSVELSNYNAAISTWSVTIAETADDHGDDIASATSMNVGTPINGVAETASDYDYFAVSLNANQTYTISQTNTPTIYAYMQVFNSAGTAQITEAYTTRTFTPTVAGTYYVRVRPYSASYLGAYTLSVQ